MCFVVKELKLENTLVAYRPIYPIMHQNSPNVLCSTNQVLHSQTLHSGSKCLIFASLAPPFGSLAVL